MRPYHLLITMSAILYVYSFLIALYYVLPVDASKRKIIPGQKLLSSRIS
jgi:hypothetical protein